jgi:hypothetical protein
MPHILVDHFALYRTVWNKVRLQNVNALVLIWRLSATGAPTANHGSENCIGSLAHLGEKPVFDTCPAFVARKFLIYCAGALLR